MIDKKFLESLTPVEIQMVHQYIGILFKEKITEKTGNHENLEGNVEECPHCKGKHIVRNGCDKRNGHRKYLCRECRKSFSAGTGTFFFHSKAGYHIWITFIACEIVGLTLRDEAQILGRSVTSCFHMRHKFYDALRDRQDEQKLSGLCEIDGKYTSINLKGRKKDMPRLPKKRGKHKPDPDRPNLRGISHHKICMISAIDERDHILFKIAGLGPETFDMYEKFSDHFLKKCTLVSDEKTCISAFAKRHSFTQDPIPSGSYCSKKGNSLSDLNQIHQSFNELIRKKHGISTRHLQGYIDFLVVSKQMRYRIEAKKMNTQIYMDIMKKPSSFTTEETCKIPLPVDLKKAYEEYGMIH